MKNKILTISIIFILISFCFVSNSFAVCIDTSYDYLYSYNIIEDDQSTENVETILKDDRVISGDYYYFCYYNTGNYCYMTVLVPKNLVTTNNFKFLDFYQKTEKCQSFGLYLSDSNICSSIIRINGSSGYDGSNGTNLWVGGYYDETNKCFNFPFATNFDEDIDYICSNGDVKNFFQATPTVPEIPAGKIPETMAEIMKTAGEQATLEMGQIILIVIMTTAGLMVLLIGLKKGLTVLMNGFRH